MRTRLLETVLVIGWALGSGLCWPARAAPAPPWPPVPQLSAGPEPDPVGVWPLLPRPEVVRTFDPPDSPYGAGHRGVDLLGRLGQPVDAALPGRVTYAGVLAGRGVVVVDHGSTRTTYEPVAAGVEVGTVIAAGEQVGTLQLDGSHCFPRACLHWGWRTGDTYLDPLRLVGVGPVRLLPLWGVVPALDGAHVPLGSWSPPLLPYDAQLTRLP